MAVSQFLRPESLIDAVKNHFTPDVVQKASSLVGEPESSTRSALNAAVPSVLTGLVNRVSSHGGANTVSALIGNGEYGPVAESASSLFSGGTATNNMMSAGQQLLGKIFGNKSSSVADIVAKSSGVSSASAAKLLSLAAPLTLGVLGKTSAGQDSASLVNTLLHGRSEILAAAPPGLSQALGTGSTDVCSDVIRESAVSEPVSIKRFAESESVREPAPVVTEQPPAARGMRWLPLLLLALAAAGLLLYLRGRSAQPRNTATETVQHVGETAAVNLPGGRNISVPKGSINYELAAFLADPSAGPLPKTFVFDNLNFESASTQLTPQSTATVNNLAEVLKAYPTSRVELGGHTDNTGTAEANQTLSLNRANAVKALLVNEGVSADSISTNGYGQTRPVASNDTDEGRERNRRLELNVTSK
jgi:outer membrane protein OmpA-like peptidoglycan-associated protein